MKLAGFDLYRYDLPLAGPVALKGATLRRREGLLLRLTTDDGTEGWGEAAPLLGFSHEDIDEAARQARELAAQMPGLELPDPRTNLDAALGPNVDRAAIVPSVRFALELALWNLFAQSTDRILPELMKDDPEEVLSLNGLLSGSSEEVLADADKLKTGGYQAAKLKVGGLGVEEDVELVLAVRRALGDGVTLRLDANRAWGLREAVRFARGVSGVGVEYVEEPLSEPWRLPDLAREWGLPVALDESLVGMRPGELERHRYAGAVVLKPALVGGISRTLDLADRALRLGMTPVISSSYESGVGTAALIALAAAMGGEPAPAGLDTYRRLAGDVLEEPLKLPAPFIDVRGALALAHEVDPDRLELLRAP